LAVLLLQPLVHGLLAPHADHAREVLALGLGDAEILVGPLHLLGDLVPAVVAPGGGRRVENEVIEVQAGKVNAPPRDRLAFEDLERSQAPLRHPLALVLDLAQLAHDPPGDALAGTQLAPLDWMVEKP